MNYFTVCCQVPACVKPPSTPALCCQQANSSKLPRVGWRGNMFGVNPRLSEWLRRVSQVLCNTEGREGGKTSSTGLREGAMKGGMMATGERNEPQVKWVQPARRTHSGRNKIMRRKERFRSRHEDRTRKQGTINDRNICRQWWVDEQVTKSATLHMFHRQWDINRKSGEWEEMNDRREKRKKTAHFSPAIETSIFNS